MAAVALYVSCVSCCLINYESFHDHEISRCHNACETALQATLVPRADDSESTGVEVEMTVQITPFLQSGWLIGHPALPGQLQRSLLKRCFQFGSLFVVTSCFVFMMLHVR